MSTNGQPSMEPQRLVELLGQQMLVGGDETLAKRLAKTLKLRDITAGEVLIRQDEADRDLYLLLSGTLRILVNGREVANRRKGTHIGEMAIIDPAARRTSTVVAAEPCLVAVLSNADFTAIANEFPGLWRAIAIELSRRLDQRKEFYRQSNTTPILIIGASREGMPIAEGLASHIPPDIATTVLWLKSPAGTPGFPTENAALQLSASDFAVLVAPREDMIFELGLFTGALGKRRTCLMTPRGTAPRIPAGSLGLTCVCYDEALSSPAAQTRQAADELIEVMRRIGPK